MADTPPPAPPATTADFEFLLDKTNVVAVEYDPATNTVHAWVSQKLRANDLDPADNVNDAVPDAFNVDVHDVGYGEERGGFDPADIEPYDLDPDAVEPSAPAGERQQRHRPVEGGLSESHAAGTAATGGLLATVTDPSRGEWSDDAVPGSVVRLSNNHVYARTNQASMGDPILQPSPYDGGGGDDTVGGLAGYVPLAEDVDVDVAARSVTFGETGDALGAYAMPNVGTNANAGVVRSGYQRLVGERVRKGGRTTGITDGEVRGVNATVNVAYRNPDVGDDGVVRMPNQIVATGMSAGGDSGSHVFVAPDAGTDVDGALAGVLFAGSEDTTVICKAGVVERRFGVQFMAENIETFDGESVQIPMAAPRVTLENVVVPDADDDDAPEPGEAARVTATVESSYQVPVWVEAIGPAGSTRAEATPTDDDETDDGTYVVAVELEVAAPAEYRKTFEVLLAGGYRLSDEQLGE